jgi:hypothetical protein
MRVMILPEVMDYFSDLIETLLDEEYFGTYPFAEHYVDNLIDSILYTLPYKVHYKAPSYFSRYSNGSLLYYSVFIHSKHTQWYVFFTKYKVKHEDVLLVRHISNNHVDSIRLRTI